MSATEPVAVLITVTTYGTWLRGDRLGWVEEGRTMPPNPLLEMRDRRALRFPPFSFAREQWLPVGELIGSAGTSWP